MLGKCLYAHLSTWCTTVLLQPIFLNRTLTYMRHRSARTNKSRHGFKVDSLLEKTAKLRDFPSALPGYMNLTFLGFYDKNIDANVPAVQVEAVLVEISHKKRKDSSAPLMEFSFGTVEVVVNPPDDQLPPLAPTISVRTEAFAPTNNGPAPAKSYVLLLRVRNLPAVKEEEEPAAKRRKSDLLEEPKLYVSELVVYDKHNRCLLSDADYELGLQEVASGATKTSPKKHASWENVSDLNDNVDGPNLDLDLEGLLVKGPSVKFKLNWSQQACERFVERPRPYPVEDNKENLIPNGVLVGNHSSAVNGLSLKQEKLQIVYQFVYNNNSRQQTEACEDLHCPWCSLNCHQLYVLLKHLKLCHSRFTFTYVPIAQGARVDVAINELYDGSYSGSPHDLISQPSVCAFSRNGPVRRAPVTHILVCRPKRQKPSLSEFLELDDCEYDGQRPFVTGHSRLYHHTTTCLPIYPKEMEADSEGEHDPEWLRTKTTMMIDEFTDVNEGEKELMKMWNLHVMRNGFVGDCQIPLACTLFVQHKGKELLLKNLYRNFVVHMCSLFDFGLVSAVCLYNAIQRLQEMVGETGAIRAVLKESREAQMDNWARVAVQVVEKKTPGARKAAAVGVQRRKGGTPAPAEAPPRRHSAGEGSTRKRLSLSLAKAEPKS